MPVKLQSRCGKAYILLDIVLYRIADWSGGKTADTADLGCDPLHQVGFGARNQIDNRLIVGMGVDKSWGQHMVLALNNACGTARKLSNRGDFSVFYSKVSLVPRRSVPSTMWASLKIMSYINSPFS
jgi:hypothetical protein